MLNSCDGKSLVGRGDRDFGFRTGITGHGVFRQIVGEGENKSLGGLRLGRAAYSADAVYIGMRNRRDAFRVAVAAGAGVSHNALLRARRLGGHLRGVCMLVLFVLIRRGGGVIVAGCGGGVAVIVAGGDDGIAAVVCGGCVVTCRKGKRTGERHTRRQQHDNQFLFHILPSSKVFCRA